MSFLKVQCFSAEAKWTCKRDIAIVDQRARKQMLMKLKVGHFHSITFLATLTTKELVKSHQIEEISSLESGRKNNLVLSEDSVHCRALFCHG